MNGIKIQKKSNKILYVTIGLNVILWIIAHFEQGSSNSVTSFGLFVGLIVTPISVLVIIITLIVKLIAFTNKKHKELEKTTNIKK